MPSDSTTPAGLQPRSGAGSDDKPEDISAQIREIRDQINDQMSQDTPDAAAAEVDPAAPVVEEAKWEEVEAPAADPVRPGDDPADPPPADPVPPAPQKEARGGGGGVLGLVGGALAGGCVAGALLFFFLDQPAKAPAPVVNPAAQVDLAPVTQKLAALEARPSIDPAAITALGRRLEETEASLKQIATELAALKTTVAAAPSVPAAAPVDAAAIEAALDPVKARIERLEEKLARIDGLETKLGGVAETLSGQQATLDAQRQALEAQKAALAERPAAAPPPKALLDSIAALTASGEATRGAVAEVQAQLGGLRAAQASLQSAVNTLGTTAGNAEQATLRLVPRLDAVEKGVTEARTAAEKGAGEVRAATGLGRAATAVAVFAALREAVTEGRPYGAELSAAKSVLGDKAAALDPLSASAATGVATAARLAQRLNDIGSAAIATLAPPDQPQDDSFVTRLMTSASHLVKVRPVDGIERASEGGLGKAVALVRAGRLDEALAEVAKLPPAVQDALKPVVTEIAARRTALATVAALHQQAIATVTGKVP